MTSTHRWFLVGVGVLLLVTVPLAVRAIPPKDSDISAATLLQRVQDSVDAPYSGYVETLGTLSLPVLDEFDEVGSLFGERTRMRVWWSNSEQWRLDQLEVTGETDLIRNANVITTWDYEASEINRYKDGGARLPRTSDLLPPELARLLLTGADIAEVTRLPADRIDGQVAPGLRVSPSAPQSSVDHVDVWVDPENGVALRVELYSKGADSASLSSAFLEYSAAPPTAAETTFERPPGSRLDPSQHFDFVRAANRTSMFRRLIKPPSDLAGLERAPHDKLRGLPVYGSGLTRLVILSADGAVSNELRAQLKLTPSVHSVKTGQILNIGPLSIMLTKTSFLLAGTVTEQSLIDAAEDLQQHLADPENVRRSGVFD